MSPAPTARDSAVRSGPHHQQRFPISTPVKYIVGKTAGEGVTRNIGSDGLLMKTKCVLPPGRRIQVTLVWPAVLDRRLPLRLDIRGKILRSSGTGTAVAILSYEYRLDVAGISRRQTA
jgi:hypothetical protein